MHQRNSDGERLGNVVRVLHDLLVPSTGFRIYGLRVSGFKFTVQDFDSTVSGFGVRVSSFGCKCFLWVLDSGVGVLGLLFRRVGFGR